MEMCRRKEKEISKSSRQPIIAYEFFESAFHSRRRRRRCDDSDVGVDKGASDDDDEDGATRRTRAGI